MVDLQSLELQIHYSPTIYKNTMKPTYIYDDQTFKDCTIKAYQRKVIHPTTGT